MSAGLWLAGYIETSGFKPVTFVLSTVLFAHIPAAVGAVLNCEYLTVGANCSPYERHFFVNLSGVFSLLAMVTKAVWTFLTQKDK